VIARFKRANLKIESGAMTSVTAPLFSKKGENVKKEKRFETTEFKADSGASFAVITDQKTGVQYLLSTNYAGTGLTPLLGRDGQPLLNQGI